MINHHPSFLVLGIILIHDVNPLQLDRRGPVVHLADLAKTVVVKKVVARSIIALAARRSPLVVHRATIGYQDVPRTRSLLFWEFWILGVILRYCYCNSKSRIQIKVLSLLAFLKPNCKEKTVL